MNQYSSALTTSPRALVPKNGRVCRLMLSLMNRTEPSANAKLAPPGWRLWKANCPRVWQARMLIQSGRVDYTCPKQL